MFCSYLPKVPKFEEDTAFRNDHIYIFMLRLMYDLTSVSPVYSEDPSVHQRSSSDLHLLLYHYETDPVLSDVRSLISELNSESSTTFICDATTNQPAEQHTLHSLSLYKVQQQNTIHKYIILLTYTQVKFTISED